MHTDAAIGTRQNGTQHNDDRAGKAGLRREGSLLLRPRRIASMADLAARRRRIFWLKLLLAGTALLILAALFAWPRLFGAMTSLADLGTVSADQSGLGMKNARFQGIDGKGNPFMVTASAATPLPGRTARISLTRIQADLTLNDALWLSITAPTGVYDREAGTMLLSGGIDVYTDAGYELHTDSANIDLKKGMAEGIAPISGQGPLGDIAADSYRISEGGKVLKLTGNVMVTLYPGRRQ